MPVDERHKTHGPKVNASIAVNRAPIEEKTLLGDANGKNQSSSDGQLLQ
jgi:hypothetical protein